MKTFPFGLFLMGHISVFQLNDPKSMNFFYNFKIFRISCGVACKYDNCSKAEEDSNQTYVSTSRNIVLVHSIVVMPVVL